MAFKVSGDANDGSKVIVIDETTWEVESTGDAAPSTYEVPCLQVSGTKTVFARRDSDGEFVGYGNISPVYYISNYWGDRSLGDVQFQTTGIVQTGNVTDIDSVLGTGNKTSGGGSSSYNTYNLPTSNVYEFTVPNVNGAYDGDMVVAQFKDLVIDEGVWLTVKQPCRGLFIYVSGDCTINGILSMKARGAGTDPTSIGGSDSSAVDASGIRLPMLKNGSTETLAAAVFDGCGTSIKNVVANQTGIDGDGVILAIQRIGGAGNPRSWSQAENPAIWPTPIATSTGQTGGGSGGFSRWHPNGGTVWGGSGGVGSCFSGGAAGGNGYCNWDCYSGCANATAGTAQSYGRQGGSGICQCSSTSLLCCSGGAGNPHGTNSGGNCVGAGHSGGAGNGTGGVIWLLVAGNLTVGSNGHINCDGIGSEYGNSGGGAMIIAYAGNLTNNGAITAEGLAGNASDGSIQQVNVSC